MYHVEPQLLLPAVLTLHTLETLIMEKCDIVQEGKFERKNSARETAKLFVINGSQATLSQFCAL